MYKFSLMYPNDYDSLFTFPIAPEAFNTKVGNKNKSIDLLELGEVNIVKSIGLREFSFKVLLPKDSQLCDDVNDFKEPIFYMNKLREIKEQKKTVILTIIRTMPNGETLFGGNVEVSLEDYSVEENGGEEGDFHVELNFKEYKRIKVIALNDTGVISNNGKTQITQEEQRAVKDTAESYTVKPGDSLWKIAKLQMNDGSRYKEIAELNGISNPNSLKSGMVLKLP